MEVADGRHFRNEFDDSAEPEGWEPELRRALEEGERKVRAARHANPTIYTGGGGVAWMLLHLAERGACKDPQEAAAEALRRLEAEEPSFDAKRLTLLQGLPGSVVLQAWAHSQRGAREEAAAAAARLGALAGKAVQMPPEACELLFGRCGFLAAVGLARRLLGDAALLAGPAAAMVRDIVAEGKRRARDDWPLYYEWHDKCYLGGAHGFVGILLTLLQLPEELAQAAEDARDLVRATGEVLLSRRYGSGNLPSSEGNPTDRCVHWCHGAPGLVPLLAKMASAFGEDSKARYLDLAREAGEVVWRRGLLSTKGPGLCHGIPGNGYAFLVLHRATGDRLWLRRAQHFAVEAAKRAEALTGLADTPYSLFEGLAGAVCFWADVLHAAALEKEGKQSDVRFPCYEF